MGKTLKAPIFLFLILIFLIPGIFAGSASINTFDLNVASATTLSGVKATLTYLNTGDFNALCFNTSDSSSGSTCQEGDFGAFPSLTLDYSLISGMSSNAQEGSHTIYAFVKQDDGGYSASTSKGLVIDASAPTYTVFPANNSDHNVGTLTFDINFTDSSTPVVSLIKLNGTTTITDGSSLSPSDGTHTITIDANDALGNAMATATITFRVDTNAPTSASVSSANSSSYTNSSTPTITASATDTVSGVDGGQIALSCKPTGAWYVRSYATTITDFNIVLSSYDCNTSDGNKLIYVKFKDAAGNWTTSSVITNALIDRTVPSAPSGLSATVGNAQVELSWSAPAADSLPGSGNAGYKVYKDNALYATVTSATTKTVTGLTNGTSYGFKVRTYDNAGNLSEATADVNATPSAGPVANATITVKRGTAAPSYVKNGDALTVTCSFSYDVNSARIYYKYRNPDQAQEILEGPTSNVSSIEDTITLASGYTSIDFWCNGTQYSATVSSSTNSISFDNTGPTIAWSDANDTNAEWSGTKIAVVTATDDKGMDTVEFELNGIKYGATKETGTTKYSYSFNTKDYNNTSYTLKAIGKDMAGNTTTITKSITIHNILNATQMAEEAIAQAKAKKIIVEDLMKFFATEGLVFPVNLVTEKSAADLLLKDAEAIKNSDSNKATEKANSAKVKYSEINSAAAISSDETKTKFYEYDSNNLVEILLKAGLNQDQADEANKLITGTKATRKLVIVKVGNDANAGYQAKIEITFTSDTNDSTLKIVEIIPKEFAQKATQIFSDYNFVIINNDPIIEFTVPVTKGKSVKISYGIGNITKEQAEGMISNNLVAKFSSPPIIISARTNVAGTLGGFPDIVGILMWVGIILIVLIVAGGIIYFLMQKKSPPLGKDSSIAGTVKDAVVDKIIAPENKKSEENQIWEHK
ncbi:MAG: Ig-like domain-containing protein [Candidatus Diapherotrites archaeon]|nr:Ig-like domain-containing protein [Candidatus Diapherotrites archaeon]